MTMTQQGLKAIQIGTNTIAKLSQSPIHIGTRKIKISLISWWVLSCSHRKKTLVMDNLIEVLIQCVAAAKKAHAQDHFKKGAENTQPILFYHWINWWSSHIWNIVSSSRFHILKGYLIIWKQNKTNMEPSLRGLVLSSLETPEEEIWLGQIRCMEWIQWIRRCSFPFCRIPEPGIIH